MMAEPRHLLKQTMYKPSEPLSDAEDECNLNSPIFGRKNMEEYFYDSSEVKKKDDEENEYSGSLSVTNYLYKKEIYQLLHVI